MSLRSSDRDCPGPRRDRRARWFVRAPEMQKRRRQTGRRTECELSQMTLPILEGWELIAGEGGGTAPVRCSRSIALLGDGLGDASLNSLAVERAIRVGARRHEFHVVE